MDLDPNKNNKDDDDDDDVVVNLSHYTNSIDQNDGTSVRHPGTQGASRTTNSMVPYSYYIVTNNIDSMALRTEMMAARRPCSSRSNFHPLGPPGAACRATVGLRGDPYLGFS